MCVDIKLNIDSLEARTRVFSIICISVDICTPQCIMNVIHI